jgi:hypothetical protein
MGRGAAERPRTHNLRVSSGAINPAVTAVVIFRFLSCVTTEAPGQLTGLTHGRKGSMY